MNISKKKGIKIYEQIYDYYLKLMRAGILKEGGRMPSLRETEKNLGVSRTSVETAYMQLAADGYIYSIEKSGFYISNLASKEKEYLDSENNNLSQDSKEIISGVSYKKRENIKEGIKERLDVKPEDYLETDCFYDFATIGEDARVSCMSQWTRYVKNALRHEYRLLSYGANQGEEDLREEIVRYIRKQRNIICSKDDIVIGAGFQNLLQILIPLLEGDKTVSLPNISFVEAMTIFKQSGFEISHRNKYAKNIYVTPAYMTKWGEVMTMKRRHELIDHSKNDNHFIIEDDYQNEFVFSQHATPSLYAMAQGENVAYLGSFSRVLLPSVRISFLILPIGYNKKYQKIKNYYNQTASKTEQIALTGFLRDGQLVRNIKKMRRLYEGKRVAFESALKEEFKDQGRVLVGESGMEFGLEIINNDCLKKMAKSKISAGVISENDDMITLLLSCSIMDETTLIEGTKKLKESLIIL